MNQFAENIHPIHDNLAMPKYLEDQPTSEPYIWGITGGSGGVGVTTICTQLAYWLAKPKKRRPLQSSKTCLVELDFENGSLSQYLDSPAKVEFDVFCQPPDRLDQDLVKSWLTRTAFGFSLFSIPTAINGNHLVNSDTVLKCLDHICTLFDYIVIDIPQLWAPWTQAALATADRIAVVTQLNVPALHLARRRSEGLINAVDELNKTDFILNKVERRSFRSNLKVADAERAFDVPYVNPLALCNDQVREALNRGEPVGATYPESRFVRDTNDVFETWFKQSQSRADDRKAVI